jgi:D-alanine-D-alanine ligase-like ATP-grasp enzyme
MQLFHFVALRGPNRWAPFPILEVHFHQRWFSGFSRFPPDSSQSKNVSAPSDASKCSSLLQTFLDAKQFTTSHPQSIANATHIVEGLATCADESALWLECARWFSAMAGVPTREISSPIANRPIANSFSNSERQSQAEFRSDSADEGGSSTVFALEMEEQALTEKCVKFAFELIESLGEDTFSLGTKVRELFDFADDVRLGPSSRAILRAARRRNIPYMRLNSGSLVQLGEGRRQRRIWTAETDATSAIAEAIASDKDLTKRLLRQVGVPVPHGRAVVSAADAWKAAQEIGFPVVVKPCNANHQRGISIELSTEPEILKAYDWAIKDGETNEILVEQFAIGHHHRLLVVGNQLVAAAKGHNESVLGDGISTIEQLVDRENQDPRRGEAYTDPLGLIKLSEPAIIELNKQGYHLQSVPADGKRVVVRRTGDLTTDCTEAVHPDTAEQAVLAARVVGLDIAGLDILANDISVPLLEQRGAVVEVNAGPALSPHVSPLYGKPQKVGDAIVSMLFPSDQRAHIKIIGVIQSPTSDSLMQQLAEQLRLRNIDFGMLSHGQAGFNGRIVDTGCATDEERVIALLSNPILSAIIVHIEIEPSALYGVCAPRIDRLLIAKDAIASSPHTEHRAGVQAILNAVPASGEIYGDRLSDAAFDLVLKQKNVETSARNSLERAFVISFD